jgi:plasmid maintenance system antidote protein VapI
MPAKELNALDALQAFVDQFETQAKAAAALDIQPSYMNDLIHCRRDISDNILKKLGLKRVVVKQ